MVLFGILLILIIVCKNVLTFNNINYNFNRGVVMIKSYLNPNEFVYFNKKYKGKISSGEVGLPMKDSNLVLPCGIYGLWEDE